MHSGDEPEAHELEISTPAGTARAVIGIDGGRLTLTITEVPDGQHDPDGHRPGDQLDHGDG